MKILYFTSPTGDMIPFQICDYTSEWNECGGIYMFCRFNSFALLNGRFVFEPIYIGKASNFKMRLPNHEKWEESFLHGAEKVLAVVEESKNKRSLLEYQLIQIFDPPVNKQLRPSLRIPKLGIATQTALKPLDVGPSLVPQVRHTSVEGQALCFASQASHNQLQDLAPQVSQKPEAVWPSLVPRSAG